MDIDTLLIRDEIGGQLLDLQPTNDPIGPYDSDFERHSIAEIRLNALAQLLGGWLWETDSRHRFCYMTSGVEAFIEKPVHWLYGTTTIHEIGDQPLSEKSFLELNERLDAHLPFNDVDFCRLRDGKRIWIRVSGWPIFGSREQFAGYRGFACDVTMDK